MIVILLHPLTGNGEFVYSTRANCRSSLTPQNNLLGKLFIIFLIFMRSIVKSGNIPYCSHIIIDNGIRCIHPLCDRTGRVFTMTDFLQEIRPTVREPHFRYTTSPHSDYYDNGVLSSSNPSLPIRQKHGDSRSLPS